MKFKDYLRMILGLSIPNSQSIPKIRKSKSVKKPKEDKMSGSEKNEQLNSIPMNQLSQSPLNRIAILITRFMIVLALLSLVAIIYFATVGQEAPPILSDLLSGTLGYLGGMLASYASFATSKEK